MIPTRRVRRCGFISSEQGKLPSSPGERYLLHQVMQVQYFPMAFLCVFPFAVLPWKLAGVLWTVISVTTLTFAAILVSDVAGRYTPVVSIALTCIILANIESIVESGNPAGIAVALCVIAVYCLLRERFGWVGVLCLAVSLCLKPHVTGFVWLYFLLAGGTYRKRALQALLMVAALGLAATLLVWHVSPHWMQELQANIIAAASPGGLSDPRPVTSIIDLQTVTSTFWKDPRSYNTSSYVICGALLVPWAFAVLVLRPSTARARGWHSHRSLRFLCCQLIIVSTMRLYCCSPFQPVPSSGPKAARLDGLQSL